MQAAAHLSTLRMLGFDLFLNLVECVSLLDSVRELYSHFDGRYTESWFCYIKQEADKKRG